MKLKIAIIALLLILSVNGGAFRARGGSNKPDAPAQKRRNEKGPARKGLSEGKAALSLEKQLALGRLETLAERAKDLNNSILKVKILAKVADALWEHDEARARQLFVSAFQAIDAIKLDAKQDQRVELAERRRASDPSFYLRSSLLQLLARRDLKLAEDLRKSYEKEVSKTDNQNNKQLNQAEQAQLYLDLAVASAKTQPQRSAQLIRSFLPSGINHSLTVALLRIRAENPLLADQLFSEVLALARVRRVLPHDIESLAIFVLPTEEDEFFGRNPANDPARVPVIQKFLDYVYVALSSQLGPPNSLILEGVNGIDAEQAKHEYQILRNLLPFFERLQPERTAFVREKMAALLGFMTPQAANSAEPAYRESVEDLVRQADSTVGTRQRTIRLLRASAAALKQGDVEKALDIAQRLDDLYERKIQTSIVRYQAAMKELRAGELDRAYQYAKEIEFLPQRVAIFHRMAQKLWKDKEPERARAILEEIWDWLGKADNSPQKAEAMLQITTRMAQYDKARGFEFLQSAVKVLNDTDFSYKPLDRDKISVEVHIALDMLDLESSFTTLTRADSERAFLIAQSLTKAEASLLAQAIVSQQVLAPRR